MKVLALGGCGDMGRMAVAILLESGLISHITVADKNYSNASTFIDLVDSNKLSAVQIDVNNRLELKSVISKHDIVINTVGPFYKFGDKILKATIEAYKPYLDICDDWKPTLEMLNLNDKAKNEGITAIIGIGASPGITNLMSLLACSELDEIDEIVTAWGMGQTKMGKKPKYFIKEKTFYKNIKKPNVAANAAIMHFFYETLGEIPTYKEGEIIYIKSLSEAPPVQFPGFKQAFACHIGHPEPITLPRTIKVKSVSNVMFLGKKPTDIVREFREKISKKIITIEEASIEMAKQISKLRRNPLIIKEFINYPPETCVIVTGLKKGIKKQLAIGCYRNPYGEMAGDTGVPLAIATQMLLDGEIKKKGVLSPEEAINPELFFNKYAKFCGRNLTAEDILIKRTINL
ncbi:MAG: saccharopine dehydrogenase family protein [Candidatus Thorarchaeota archaeon]